MQESKYEVKKFASSCKKWWKINQGYPLFYSGFTSLSTIFSVISLRYLDEAGNSMLTLSPVSILHKSIAGRYRSFRVADGPITACYRFMSNASWERAVSPKYHAPDTWHDIPLGQIILTPG